MGIHEAAIGYVYSILKNVDSLHGQPDEEPQRGLIEHNFIDYKTVRKFLFFVESSYSLTPKGYFVLREIEKERSKTACLEDKTLTS